MRPSSWSTAWRRTQRPPSGACGFLVKDIEPGPPARDLRHTYATFALRAGVSEFAVSRLMGCIIAMIDRHYGHLARDGREHAVSLLDALAIESAVDAGWTPPRPRSRRLFAVT
jgi:integrase